MSKLITKLGLPLLRQETYDAFMEEATSYSSYEGRMQFVKSLYEKIWQKDSLYGKFISDVIDTWSITEGDIVLADLTTGYELLSREGELPRLNEEKFKKRWDATMNKGLSVLNVGMNMPIIEKENPVFARFISNQARNYPLLQGINLSADLSSGYMFLVDSVKR